jgi:hypothetical protein
LTSSLEAFSSARRAISTSAMPPAAACVMNFLSIELSAIAWLIEPLCPLMFEFVLEVEFVFEFESVVELEFVF